MSKCLKCQKEYIPKRRGGKFCSTSCRVAYHQRVQRGLAVANPPSGDEVYLASKLAVAGELASELESQIIRSTGMPTAELYEKIKQLISYCATFPNNGIVQNIMYKDARQRGILPKAEEDEINVNLKR